MRGKSRRRALSEGPIPGTSDSKYFTPAAIFFIGAFALKKVAAGVVGWVAPGSGSDGGNGSAEDKVGNGSAGKTVAASADTCADKNNSTNNTPNALSSSFDSGFDAGIREWLTSSIKSSSNEIFMHFHSDSGYTRPGFKLEYHPY